MELAAQDHVQMNGQVPFSEEMDSSHNFSGHFNVCIILVHGLLKPCYSITLFLDYSILQCYVSKLACFLSL